MKVDLIVDGLISLSYRDSVPKDLETLGKSVCRIVSESKILDDAITAPKIADNSVGVGEINVTDGTAGQILCTTGAGTLVFADSINEIIITPTVGQTQFSGLDYVIGRMAVYLNGVKLLNGTDFTANDGTTMTLTAGATATDKIELQIFA